MLALVALLATGSAHACADKVRADGFGLRAIEAYDKGDSVLAAVLWRQAARAGARDAMTALGGLYDIGDGVAADPRTARRWYARAARRGDAHAMLLLADSRLSLDPSDREARDLIHRAAALGHPFAKRHLAALSGDADGLTEDSTGDQK